MRFPAVTHPPLVATDDYDDDDEAAESRAMRARRLRIAAARSSDGVYDREVV